MTTNARFGTNRRAVLAGIAASIALPGMPRATGSRPERLRELVLHGPPAGPSITLAVAAAGGYLSGVADKVSFRVWRNPDEMRAGLTSGSMNAVVMPTAVAANLYNRGLGIRLVNVMTEGLLHVVATDASLTSVERLAGKTIAVPFRNDTPDIVLERLLAAKGMEAGRDLVVETTGTPIEAMQLLLAGRIDAALVPEPAASAAIVRGSASGVSVSRVIDIQEAWGALTGKPAILPQAGLAVRVPFLEEAPDRVAAIADGLAEATRSVIADPARAAGAAASALELPWPVVEQSIRHSRLVATPAREARETLEDMLSLIAEVDPSKIGGQLPDPAFYL